MDRRNNFLFLVLLGTVGVLAAAILFGGADDDAGPVSGGRAGVGASESADPSARSAELREDQRRAAAGETGDGERREVVTPAAAAGDGKVTLRGRLVGADNAPAADVEVSWRGRSRSGLVFITPFGDDREGGESTRTGDDGRFEMRVEAGRAGSLQIDRAASLLFASGDARRTDVAAQDEDTDLGDLPVTAAGRLIGRVVDEAGSPVPAARVRANRDALAIWMPGRGQSVDGEGVFELIGLEPGRHSLGAEASGFVPATMSVEVGAGEVVRDLELRLSRGASIAGTVLDDRGRPVAGAKVAAFRKRDVSPNVKVQGIDTSAAVEADTNGYFVLSGIEGASASLRAWTDGCAPQTLGDVPVGTGNVTFRLERLGRITGKLLDTEDRPLAGSRVSARVIRDLGEIEPMLGMGRSAETDDEGLFAIEGVRPGTVTLEARGASHLPIEGYTVQVLAGTTVSNVTLRAETGAVVVATVVDATGKPVEAAQVMVTEPPRAAGGNAGARRIAMRAGGEGAPGDVQMLDGPGPRVLREARTGADGQIRLAGLPTGPVRVRASGGDHAPSRPVDLSVPRRGDVEAFLTLRAAGRVEVRTVTTAGEPAPEVAFVLRGPQGADEVDQVVERGNTDAAGVARVGPLLEGRYTAVLERSARASSLGGGMTFVVMGSQGEELTGSATELMVTAGQTVEVVLKRPVLTRVFGTVQAATGPASGVEVRLLDEDAPPFAPGWVAKTDGQGRYELKDVASGRYRIEWGRTEQLVKDHGELEVIAGTPELRHDLDLRGGSVRVEVWSEIDGEPVVEAEVSLRRAGEPQRQQRGLVMVRAAISMDDSGGGSTQSITMGGPGRVRTGADGVAVIEDVPPGEYDLVVERKGHTDGRVEKLQVIDGRVTDAGTVRLTVAGVVTGTVTGFPDGQDMRIAMIELRRVGSEDQPRRETAMEGSFRIDRLEPGDWELRAQHVGPGAGDEHGPWRRVTVRAGATEEIELPLSGS